MAFLMRVLSKLRNSEKSCQFTFLLLHPLLSCQEPHQAQLYHFQPICYIMYVLLLIVVSLKRTEVETGYREYRNVKIFHLFSLFLSLLSTLIRNAICFLHAQSILCWKMSKVLEFELKFKKLRRKT